jgi:DNA mismatch endonuclease, patch repair protein
MVDHITADQRSALMARIHGRDTRPEKFVRSMVHRMGFRFRIGTSSIPGKPDLVLRRHRKVIFVHGCFWHQHPGCRRSARPRSGVRFWNTKLDRNIQRDEEVRTQLAREGWLFLIVWECETRDRPTLEAKLRHFFLGDISKSRRSGIRRRKH